MVSTQASPTSTPGSLMTSTSTVPSSTTKPHTSISNGSSPLVKVKSRKSSSSELSTLDSDEPMNGKVNSAKNGNSVDEVKKVKKRKAEDKGGLETEKKKSKVSIGSKAEEGEIKEKGTFCHQCRQRQDADAVLRCTRLKQHGKSGVRPCNAAYCYRDLKGRYGIDPEAIKARGKDGAGDQGEHDSEAEYVFSCPWCMDDCQCSPCRKKKGLQPLGNVTKAAHDAGLSNATELFKKDPKIKQGSSLPTAIQLFDGDSDLSDLVAEEKTGAEANDKHPEKTKSKKPKTEVNSASTQKKKTKPAAVSGTPKKGVKDVKGKVKATLDGSAKKAKAKATPVKKVEIPIEPPVFDKVDTKLGKEEAEQRMQIREYIVRFRPVLSIPERSLGALDDFDRPMTEASVRLFAGAMLDLIRDELEHSNGDEDLIETITHHREELRYYADLARFATIFNILSPLIRFRLPPAVAAHDRRSEANATAIRAILDLDDNSPAPSWATEMAPAGPSRRVGASRIPQPTEAIRMLLAVAERTLTTPTIRSELDQTSGENEGRRRFASQQKAEVNSWEGTKKKLMEAQVVAKTPAETRAKKELFKKEQHEHDMRLAFLNVNLRAFLGRKALRHEPIGTDLDDRVYYVLSPRMIEDDGRPPIGWASGLLIWGKGVPTKSKQETDDATDLPPNIERWSHFGKSESVKQLVKWLEYRTKKAVQAAKPAKMATPRKTPNGKLGMASPKSGFKGKSTPIQTTLFIKPTPGKAMSGKSTPRQILEVVIPISSKKLEASRSASTLSSLSDVVTTKPRISGIDKSKLPLNDDDSSTSSALSSVPESDTLDFTNLLPPAGYVTPWEIIDEQGKKLVSKLNEVVEWLEVLEWKGLGEVD